ncbi:MAG TPA: hypothetical protein VFQ37_10035, partial [Mycobacterium sp.]|nr:hypothetical protein [Mycobacterium sp.]
MSDIVWPWPRAVTMGIQATSAVVGATVRGATAAAEAVGTVASVGLEIATAPVREGAKLLSGEISPSTLTRRCWRGDDRAWIEVRGLNGSDGAQRGLVVLDALQGCPGVTSVNLNRPLSRAVVDLDGGHTSLSDLCSVIDDAEKRCREVDDVE